MNRERIIITESQETVTRFKKNYFSGTMDQFYKLIEYDDGVPFQLVFGKEPGDGYYLFVGDGIEKLTGIKSSHFTERSFRNMVEEIIPVSECTPPEPAELRRKILSGEISDYRIEMKVSASDGTKKWLRETSIPVKDEETGNVTGIMGILHDISDRKLVLEYLDEAREKACENDRLKTTFLQNITHEVRTPLNAIVGFSTLLCEPGEGYNPKKEFVSMINNSADHFLEIMDNIMEISRIEAGSTAVVLSEVNADDIIRRIMNLFRSRAEDKGILLSCNSPAEEIILTTDSNKLSQILNNLMENALKFTLSGKIEFGFHNNIDSVRFFVSDTGIGISESHKPYIFNKFYQAESGSTRRFPGVGLGLAIAKAYVEMLGGKISFASEMGSGSTFMFTLPK